MLGSGGGAAPGLDFSAVLQLAVAGLVLLSAAFAALRRAASRYFVVDAAGFAASYEDHHHGYTPPPARVKQEDMSSAGGEKAPCAECRRVATKKCTGCKRVRYCSQECQSKHWRADHKFKCKQMKLLDPADKLCRDEAKKKSSGFGPISLVPAHGKGNKILFPYDEFLKLYNWKDLNFGPCGLVNCGNSCFANVVLQCLSCTRPLVAYLLGKDHSRECARRHRDWCFLCELQRHIQRASESLHPFAPMNILSHLPNIGGNLGFGRQEDAHEFMRFAIDKMQSACLNEFGGEKAVDLITQETTLIQHMFGGRLQSQVQCTACGMVSNRYDNMMDLTVEIQGDAESLEECLDQFTAVEWLDGDNKYKCDGCNDYVKARKRLTVHQAPNILTITLKRFQSGRFGKLNKRITFPMELDLRPYMSSTDGSDLYELYAVVVHLDMMNASFFGHYICYTKDYQGRWYRIDDCKVMTIAEDEVLAQGAYMLLYNRITARPRPLIAPEEPPKQQQQFQVLPLNGQNHLNSIEEASSNGEASSKYLKDSLPEDSRIDNESSHKLDVMYRESAMDLHNDTEGQKPAMNENLQGSDLADMPSSSALDVLEEPNYVPDSLLKCSKMSKCLGSSTGEASSVPFSSEQCQEPGASSDSVDYMEVDTDASTAIEKWNDQTPELDYSIGRMDDRTRNSTLENVSAGKPKELLSRGFLDRLPRKKSSFGEDRYQLGNGVASSQELNGYSNGHHNSQQEYHTNSFTCNTSSGMAECNGGLFPTSNNGIHSFSNGGNKSSSDSSPAESLDVPFVSRGFTPRPYRGTSGGSMNRNKTNGGTLLVGDNNNYFRNSPADDCHGDMSFLHRGFLERPCTREQSVRDNDNGTLSFVNGNGKSSINPSAGDDKGGMPFFSPGFLTRRYRESSVMGTSTSCVHDQKTRSNISSEQASLGAAEYVDQTRERWSSDCMTNGRESQHKASINGNGSSHHGENGHAILESNMISREVNNGDVTPDANSSNYQKDDGSAMLVSGEYMGSENVDQLKFLSRKVLDHEGLRRRLTVKFPEQNGIDAQ